jgi:hypothetical protein
LQDYSICNNARLEFSTIFVPSFDPNEWCLKNGLHSGGLNPGPLGHESSALTTRPRLLAIVSIFEGNPFITLKRFWHTSAASAEAAAAKAAGGAAVKSSSLQPGRWHACYGSFGFSLHDDALELYRFAKHCLLLQEEAEDERRKFMSEMLKKRASYHDAAIFPPAELCTPTKEPNLESKQIETNETKHSSSSFSSSSSFLIL